ncbi:MAG: hypothetical protein ABI543_05910 [Ignavibacteria bacterium]
MKIIALLSIVFVLVFNSCSGSDSEKSLSLKNGKYSYVISDSSGNSLVEGQIMLDKFTQQKDTKDYVVNGSYTVSKMTTDTSYHGFSSMNPGELTGYYNDSKKFININTNPKIADANVFINANIKSSNLEGGWYYSSFRGSDKEGGLFKAIKLSVK